MSNQDYLHAQLVWDVFNILNLEQYHDLYMKTDVHLFADVFENFRDHCIDMYGLDAALFFLHGTMISLAGDPKMTVVKFELMTDPDICISL